MAAITAIDTNKIAEFDALVATLTADDTITFDSSRTQLLVLSNTTAGAITVTIDGGTHGDGNTRRLSNGRQTIPYQLFVDPSGVRSYSIGQQHNFAVTSAAQIPIPVFGSVVANTRAVPAGVYTDTLTVTLDW